MINTKKIISDIFNIKNEEQFNRTALKIFDFQYTRNSVYNDYIKHLKINKTHINHYSQIPFLPIDFFKTHQILSSDKPVQTTFKSSGTTGLQTSSHHIIDLNVYEKSFIKTFNIYYGNPEKYTFLALLPSYSERNDSSLIYMTEKLMKISNKKNNGFYLYNYEELYHKLNELEQKKEKTLLIGVSFALSDFFELYKIELTHTQIIETGGMKGRKKEIVREELHQIIKKASKIKEVHSEYGMTELLSQAYAKKSNRYQTPPWMKILIRDTNDPFNNLKVGTSGGINIIDLANFYSCSFIETKDLGKLNPDGTFEISGRFDNSDIRGCNLMVI